MRTQSSPRATWQALRSWPCWLRFSSRSAKILSSARDRNMLLVLLLLSVFVCCLCGSESGCSFMSRSATSSPFRPSSPARPWLCPSPTGELTRARSARSGPLDSALFALSTQLRRPCCWRVASRDRLLRLTDVWRTLSLRASVEQFLYEMYVYIYIIHIIYIKNILHTS